MLHRYKGLFLIGFIVILALLIWVIERRLSKSRLDYIVNLVQSTQESVAFSYDFSLALPSETIESASGPIISSFPDDRNIQRAIGDFPALLHSHWTFAEDMRQKFQQYDLTGTMPTRKTEDQILYDFKSGNSGNIHLNYSGDNKLIDLSIQHENEMRSVSISYYSTGTPNRLLFGMWSHEPVGYSLKFHINGRPQEFVFYYQNMLFGPAILWNEDGTILKSRFFKRPHLTVMDKGQTK